MVILSEARRNVLEKEFDDIDYENGWAFKDEVAIVKAFRVTEDSEELAATLRVDLNGFLKGINILPTSLPSTRDARFIQLDLNGVVVDTNRLPTALPDNIGVRFIQFAVEHVELQYVACVQEDKAVYRYGLTPQAEEIICACIREGVITNSMCVFPDSAEYYEHVLFAGDTSHLEPREFTEDGEIAPTLDDYERDPRRISQPIARELVKKYQAQQRLLADPSYPAHLVQSELARPMDMNNLLLVCDPRRPASPLPHYVRDYFPVESDDDKENATSVRKPTPFSSPRGR